MPGEIARDVQDRRIRLVDEVLLALWVSAYSILLFAFGMMKRLEKSIAEE